MKGENEHEGTKYCDSCPQECCRTLTVSDFLNFYYLHEVEKQDLLLECRNMLLLCGSDSLEKVVANVRKLVNYHSLLNNLPSKFLFTHTMNQLGFHCK